MNPNEMRDHYRAFVEKVVVGGDTEAIDEFFSPAYVDNNPFPGLSPDREGMKSAFRKVHRGFTEVTVEIEEMAVDGDLLVSRTRTTAVHSGKTMGVPPTGRSFAAMEIHMVRFVDGMIVEHWGLVDALAMMSQLGLLPGMAPESELP